MLITDQKKLAKLALSLRVDIEFLLRSIQSDSANLDETSRTQFLEGLFHFLREATDLTDEKFRSHLLFSNTSLEAAPARPAISPPHLNSDHHSINDEYLHPPIVSNFNPSLESSNMSFHGMSKRRDNRYNRVEPHSLWFPNAPVTATVVLLAKQIFGGPLEGLRWYNHHDDAGFSFLINFLEHEPAAAFLDYSRSPDCRMTFPGVSEDWRPFMTWSTSINTIQPHILRAAYNPNKLARRVLVFQNFPINSVSKYEMKERLKTLESQFLVQHWVDSYAIYPNTAVAYIVFAKIESAMRVMEWHRIGLLGPEFENCEIVFGRDPSDQTFPEMKANAEAINFPPSLLRLTPEPLVVAPATITSSVSVIPPRPFPVARQTSIPQTPLTEISRHVDVPQLIVFDSPAPSTTSSTASTISSINLLVDFSEHSSSDVCLNPARVIEMANFSDTFFTQEWGGDQQSLNIDG